MLRLFGAQSTAVGKTVENFPPQWRAAAQWKSRGAETLVALQAQSPSGLKKAAQALRQAFSADLYGVGETTLPAAVVEALERHDKLLICADAAAGAERENDCVLVLSCRKGCFLRTVPAGENPALWLLDIIRRTAANKPQAEGTGFLPARRAAKKDVSPGPQPKRHPLRRVCMTLLVLALLAALAAVGAWKYTNGNFYALPEQLHTLLTEHVPRPGATLV